MPTTISHSLADGVDRNGPGGASSLLDLLAGMRPAWHRDAACHEHPGLSWFPEPGVDLGPVLAVCERCLAREDCRAWALDQGDDLAGIWGGLTRWQRRLQRAGRPAAPPPSGIPVGPAPPGRWPLEPLLAAAGLSRPGLAERVTASESTVQRAGRRGATGAAAALWAAQLGLEPAAVWPGWPRAEAS